MIKPLNGNEDDANYRNNENDLISDNKMYKENE